LTDLGTKELIMKKSSESSVNTPSEYLPKEDGRAHINIYSKGKTLLGRSLSNFAFHRFTHDVLGHFSGMEGLYYYLSTGRAHEQFRRLGGFAAKKAGRALKRVEMDPVEFEELMRIGARAVYRDNPDVHDQILDQVVANKGELLPFVHYYVYDNTAVPVVGHDWLVDEWTKIRIQALANAGGTIETDIDTNKHYAIGLIVES